MCLKLIGQADVSQIRLALCLKLVQHKDIMSMLPAKGDTTKLKPRERLFLKLYCDHNCDHAKAYQLAGYSPKTQDCARTLGSRLLRRLDSSTALDEIFSSIGLTDVDLASNLQELMTKGEEPTRVKAINLLAKAKRWFGEEAGSKGAQIIIQAAPLPNTVLKQCNVVDITPKAVDSGGK